uniref:Uncharacterized protein n=1 Tax=Arundo donax TaxID=35708 RepID=A0A0A9D4B4_ARUDO
MAVSLHCEHLPASTTSSSPIYRLLGTTSPVASALVLPMGTLMLFCFLWFLFRTTNMFKSCITGMVHTIIMIYIINLGIKICYNLPKILTLH